jgi:hypothetical protein
VALFHLVRIFMEWTVIIGDWSIPMWASWIALVVAGGLTTTHGVRARHDQLTKAALAAWFGVSTERSYRRCTEVKESPGRAGASRRCPDV